MVDRSLGGTAGKALGGRGHATRNNERNNERNNGLNCRLDSVLNNCLYRVAMKRRSRRKANLACCMAVGGSWLFGGAITDQARAQESVELLVLELGADDYLARENAQKKLSALGAEALDPLLDRLSSEDPEVAWRVADLLEQISVETRDPTKVQQVVERMTNVPGQLRQEFAVRGLRLRSEIQTLRSELAVQRLQRLGATVIASRNLGLAVRGRNDLDPVAMDPFMNDLAQQEPMGETRERLQGRKG